MKFELKPEIPKGAHWSSQTSSQKMLYIDAQRGTKYMSSVSGMVKIKKIECRFYFPITSSSVQVIIFSLRRVCEVHKMITCTTKPGFVVQNCLTWQFIQILARNSIMLWTQKAGMWRNLFFQPWEQERKSQQKSQKEKEALGWRLFRCLVMAWNFIFTSGGKLWVSILFGR